MSEIVRRLPEAGSRIFLTFDDGPVRNSTDRVFGVLQDHKVPATFFLVAEQARAQKDWINRLQSQGHAIGNHSLDHRYGIFFRGAGAMKEWVDRSEHVFREIGVRETAGFRPPAGVVTPQLKKALRDLELPLVLWDQRFYDAVLPWTKSRALSSIARLRPGSIVLLHDAQSARRIRPFCETLSSWIEAVRQKGFEFAPLPTRPLSVSSLRFV